MPMPAGIVNQTTTEETPANDISAIRERNQAEIRRRTAIDREVEALEVFAMKVIAAHASGVALNNRIVRNQARENVDATLGITREAVN